LRGWKVQICGLLAGLTVAVTLSACGSAPRQDANEPSGLYKVRVLSVWRPVQRLAQSTSLVITIRNVDTKTIPNIAVTICNTTCTYSLAALHRGWGTSVAAFGQKLNMPGLASDSRPVWIVDQAPNPNNICAFSCQQRGPGGAVTAYSNTWALGELKPNASATFEWRLTAVSPGVHVVAWQVAAGLNGKARAITVAGVQPKGRFIVHVRRAPQQSYVNSNGQVVTTG
jgi:hypothetical protein